MTAWHLNWNDLSEDHKQHILNESEHWGCPCCESHADDMAVNMFKAVVEVIRERDRAEIKATMEGIRA